MPDDGVFDHGERDDVRPGGFAEPRFNVLNRRGGAEWQRVRDLVEEWFGHVDPVDRADLRGRLRSTSDVDFRSAFFELYCHEIFRRDGWSLSVHPTLAHSGRHPDFEARRSDLRMFIEVTSTSLARDVNAAEQRVAGVIDEINTRIPIGDFFLGVDVVATGRATLRVRRLVTDLTTWLDGLDADALLVAGPGTQFKSITWTSADWIIEFDAYPAGPSIAGDRAASSDRDQ